MTATMTMTAFALPRFVPIARSPAARRRHRLLRSITQGSDLIEQTGFAFLMAQLAGLRGRLAWRGLHILPRWIGSLVMADKSDDGTLRIDVQAEAAGGLDSSYSRTAVEEPLDEADIQRE
jgi:hypothetical protein